MTVVHRFEGSFAGDDSRLTDDAVLECKICWYTYDPAQGDDVRQVEPGTPFTRLPSDWCCPQCDGARDQFMVVLSDNAVAPKTSLPTGAETAAHQATARGQALAAAFREVYLNKMRDTPMSNASLSVEAVGFRPFGQRVLGVLIAPWCMNLIVMPAPDEDWRTMHIGDKRILSFPSGDYEFVFNDRTTTGPYLACSLFSPMTEFPNQLHATDVARAVIISLFDTTHRDEVYDADDIRARRELELSAMTTPDPVEPVIVVENAEDVNRAASAKWTVTPSRRALFTGGASERRAVSATPSDLDAPSAVDAAKD
jgi:[NiFe] hydrogenase assembly HybE family chaperone